MPATIPEKIDLKADFKIDSTATIMNRVFLSLAGFWGATGVILGSLASHAFKNQLAEQQIEIFKLGVQYQMYHAIAMLGIAVWLNYYCSKLLILAGWLFCIGIIFFSLTMYGITYLGLPNIGTAPIGGIAFILGWIMLPIAAWQGKKNI